MPIVEIKETTQTISKPQQTTIVDTVKIPQTSKLVSRFGNNIVLNKSIRNPASENAIQTSVGKGQMIKD